MFNRLFIILLCLSLSSCFKSEPSNPLYEVKEVDSKKLHLIFSHNINGETHPCGCRHFPLGGLPQVAGKLNELKTSGEVILLDTGDLLFPSPKLPPTMKNSFTFGAKNLSKGMDKLGLKYFVPGDQDMALGIEFLKSSVEKVKYQYLISNLKDSNLLPHKKIVLLKKGEHKIYLLGIVDPSILTPKVSGHFIEPSKAMELILPELKKFGYDSKNSKHRLVVLSHSGMPSDQDLAKKFKNIDWVLGAHTQSFTKFPYEEGTTKLAQVLSRNHYLGEIEIDFSGDKKADKWLLHEIRDELKEKLKPNPFEKFITDHKEEMKRVQIQEQGTHALSGGGPLVRHNTASSCIECHQPQVDFWSETPHSIAYATLINASEDKNLNCIECHSVGFSETKGFDFADELIIVEKEHYQIKKTEGMKLLKKRELEVEKLKKIKQQYWDEVASAFKGVGSIRKLSKKKIRRLSKAWLKRDAKHHITNNFANVQCLNCHSSLEQEHPFAIPPEISAQAKMERMKENCLNCHIPDQSPEWYETLDNGKPGRPKHEYVIEKIKNLSCPKREP